MRIPFLVCQLTVAFISYITRLDLSHPNELVQYFFISEFAETNLGLLIILGIFNLEFSKLNIPKIINIYYLEYYNEFIILHLLVKFSYIFRPCSGSCKTEYYGCICLDQTNSNLETILKGECQIDESNSLAILKLLSQFLSKENRNSGQLDVALRLLNLIFTNVSATAVMDTLETQARIKEYLDLYEIIFSYHQSGIVASKNQTLLASLIRQLGSECLKWLGVTDVDEQRCSTLAVETKHIFLNMGRWLPDCIPKNEEIILPRNFLLDLSSLQLTVQLNINIKRLPPKLVNWIYFVGILFKGLGAQLRMNFTDNTAMEMNFAKAKLASDIYLFNSSLPSTSSETDHRNKIQLKFTYQEPYQAGLSIYCNGYDHVGIR